MKRLLAKLLPNSIKQSILKSDFVIHREAMKLAKSSKRVDLCSAQFAHMLHLAKYKSLEGKVCLEVGGGWVLSHAVVCYLLGAKRVIVVDIERYAKPQVLSQAIEHSIYSIPRDILAPFAKHSQIRERYNNLLNLPYYDFDTLQTLGIEYRAPLDLTREAVGESIDFIYSFSVLEHIHREDIGDILANLLESLNPKGVMIHNIHLEDHRSIVENPFAFLDTEGSLYTKKSQAQRGNRIRYSEWIQIFETLEQTTTTTLYRYSRDDRPIPKSIDEEISYVDEDDIRVSHIGILTQRL